MIEMFQNIVTGIFIHWDEIPETHLYALTKSGKIFSKIKSIREMHLALLMISPFKESICKTYLKR